MAIRPILKDGDPVLRRRSREISAAELRTPEMKQLIADMVETMYSANGIGIAAPQVGEPIRLCIAETSEGPIALANPVITGPSWKKSKDEEGCLSVPGKYGKVERAKSVTVDAMTADGSPIRFEASDFFARIIQHEVDHLDGILFVDRIEEQKKK